MNLDETLTSRDTINGKLRAVLDDATHKWGVKVNRVELQDINPPHDIRDAMEKQMRAERDKRAKILVAEGEKQAQILKSEGERLAEINRAEADKTARILRAEGEAESRVRTAEAESEAIAQITRAIGASQGNPVNYLVAIRYIESLQQMVSGQDNKVVYMPYEATGVLSSLGGIRELLQGKDGVK
jgi:regulator of protease activity HflC (stomatin/prohibitin superfamily)